MGRGETVILVSHQVSRRKCGGRAGLRADQGEEICGVDMIDVSEGDSLWFFDCWV